MIRLLMSLLPAPWYTGDNRYDHCGFFEKVNGVVRDLTIFDSYYRVYYDYKTANRYVGGICARPSVCSGIAVKVKNPFVTPD